MDKAGQKYWNDSWAVSNLPEVINPRDTHLNNWINRRFHQFFQRIFSSSDTSSMRLLEVGCATSAWLPYFAKEFGFQVTGLDYSPNGCDMARQVLAASNVTAEVVCANLFSPPEDMLEKFDVIVSIGVVEHFEDTSACLKALSAFLKPGGMIFTNIPNMVGAIGSLQKVTNKPVYDVHQLIDPKMLKDAHERAGFKVLDCNFFVSTSFGVCNLTGTSTRTATGLLKKIFIALISRVSMLVWLLEDRLGPFPTYRWSSPYINCVARKP